MAKIGKRDMDWTSLFAILIEEAPIFKSYSTYSTVDQSDFVSYTHNFIWFN